jgi:ABC-type multidrug transport system ATPase subunit
VLIANERETTVSATALRVRNLHVASPDGRPLISGANAAVTAGVTALLGANGAGKSTLLRTLATVHPAAGGDIVLDNINVRQQRRTYLERVMFLPQNFSCFLELTGKEFLEYSLQLRGANRSQARSIATEWLAAVGLSQAAKAQTGAYSQGMRQRLGFAYAMQVDARLYLLDEPFAGVDPESRETLTDLLFRLSEDRIIIVSTHHVDEMIGRGASICRISNCDLVMS